MSAVWSWWCTYSTALVWWAFVAGVVYYVVLRAGLVR